MEKVKPVELTGNEFDINDIDSAVRSRWDKKDPDAEFKGLEKKLIEERSGFKIYEVDGEWIRNNIDVGFGTGGHGLVHSYIPMDEIWVWPVTENKWSIALHEMIEFNLMNEEDMKYPEAHKKTNEITQGLDIKEKKNELKELLGKV